VVLYAACEERQDGSGTAGRARSSPDQLGQPYCECYSLPHLRGGCGGGSGASGPALVLQFAEQKFEVPRQKPLSEGAILARLGEFGFCNQRKWVHREQSGKPYLQATCVGLIESTGSELLLCYRTSSLDTAGMPVSLAPPRGNQ
jgi:hypothetical protein